jgi:two-component system, sensor histidine kinase and response regulator
MNPAVRIICILLFSFSLYAQEKHTIDSLTAIYNNSLVDTIKIAALNEVAKQYYRNNPDTTILLAGSALDLSKAAVYNKGIARALNIIGLAHFVKSNSSQAMDYYRKAIPYFEASGDLEGYGYCLNNIGLLHFYQADYKNAIANYLKSLAVQERSASYDGAALALNNLGLAYEHTGNPSDALQHYQKALQIYERTGNKLGIGQSLTNIGYVYSALGDQKEALASLQKAVTIQRDINDQSTLTSSLLGIAEVYRAEDNFSLASNYAADALKIAEGLKSTYDERDVSKVLYEIYKEAGSPTEALRYHEHFKALNDSIFNLENSKAMASLEARAELEKKQKDFEALEKENALRTRINYLVALAFFVTALLAWFIYRNRIKLQRAYNQLEIANDSLIVMKEELEKKAGMLYQTNEAKDKMFSVISHDLKSPLNSLKGIFELMEKKEMSSADVITFLPDISRKVTHASLTVEELLDWAASQMRAQQVRKKWISVSGLLQTTYDRFFDAANEKGVQLIVAAGKDFQLHADEDMMKTVMRNLVSNAIKFCRHGDSIQLTCSELDDRFEIVVTDTGVGISKENLTELFTRNGFTTKGTAQEKGTGLGLVLCKDFVEKNGGTILVASEQGAGTKFTMSFPKH